MKQSAVDMFIDPKLIRRCRAWMRRSQITASSMWIPRSGPYDYLPQYASIFYAAGYRAAQRDQRAKRRKKVKQ